MEGGLFTMDLRREGTCFSPAETAAGPPPPEEESGHGEEEEEAPLPTLEEVARRTNSVCPQLSGETPWLSSLSTDTLWLAPG